MAIQTAPTDLRMFIGGRGVESASGRWLDVSSPASGELIGRVPAGTAGDVDRAVAEARTAFRDGRWRSLLARRVAILERFADLIESNADALARLETLQTGTTYKLRRDSDLARPRQRPLLCFADPASRRQGRIRVQRRPHEHDPAGTGRGRRPDHAMELPAVDGGLEDRAGDRGRQQRRPQACVADAAQLHPPRRAGPGGGTARRRPEHRDRIGRRRRGGAGRPSRHRPHRPHRQHRDGQADPDACRREPQAGPSRARREGAVHRLLGRGPRGCCPRCHRRSSHQRRPGLRRGNAGVRRAPRLHAVRRSPYGAVRRRAHRRPVRSGHRPRVADQPRAPGARGRLRQAREAVRCPNSPPAASG